MTNGQLVGRYRIIEKVGDGGVGSVFKASDTRLDRMVALKFLHDRWRRSERIRDRFRREASIAASLNHPNICTVHDIEEVDGRLFIVMELLRGRPLRDYLGSDGVGPRAVIEIGRQVTRALELAHDRGVVHRDVKPANVFMCEDGVAKLLDFGVAKSAGGVPDREVADRDTAPGDTSTGRLVGTVGYMSPEQTRGEDVDARADLFSLGVVLYEAATGVRPFDAPNSSSVFDLIFSFDPPPPTCINRSLPNGFNQVVRRALCKSAAGRYASAREMRADLDALEVGVEPEETTAPLILRALRTATVARTA